tara:strand:- start:654 stop:1094 length:441 start_codon:yes stop_codon:yes gene_type:complete
MANINQLSTINTLQGGDLMPVWSTNNGDSRKASMTTLTTYMQSALTLPGALATQYAAPSSTGFSVTVSTGDTWLLLTPTGTLSGGTIVLPTGTADKSEVSVNCTQIVTSLSVTSGNTVTGAPTTLAANDFFTMRYDAATAAWYRVG